MEMTGLNSSRLPDQPPPYSPSESSNTAAVISIQPALNIHGPTTRSATLQNTYIQTQPTAAAISSFVIPKTMGPTATPYVCPSCSNMVVTKVETSITIKQHLIALLLCGIGFWPCVLIPYIMSSCKRVHHFCPICTTYIGTYG